MSKQQTDTTETSTRKNLKEKFDDNQTQPVVILLS